MKPSKIFAVGALGLLLASSGWLRAEGEQETAEYEKRLAKIKQEIDALKGKIGEEEKKEKTILSSLARIGFTKSLIRNEQALLNVQLEKNRLELAAIKKSIPELNATLEQEKQALTRILVTLYKFGPLSFVRFVFQAEDLKILLGESKHLAVLASSEERMIEAYKKNLNALGQAEADLKAKEKEIDSLIQRAGVKKAELEAEEKKDRAFMDQIRTSKKTYEQTIDELSIQARELQLLIQKFEKEEWAIPFPFVPFYEKKGKLPWPAGGKVVSSFGLQRHPQFNTVTMNNGVEIAPPKENLAVRSVHAGKVVFADYFKGYGNLIIIDHGMTYYSLYGHCAKFLAQKGDIVKTDQPIAEAGDTGSLVGVSLYFEIRYKTKPLDPLQWLGRR
jgi:septal ring factor EnvC (AmiA/AmiB activator)